MNNEPDYDNLYFEPKAKGTLTEQWKRGEFVICNAGKCQYYYVQNEKQQEVIKTEYCLFDDNTPNWQILAPVPSYEEWKDLKSKLQLKETAYDFDTARLEEENAQLKERNDSLNNRDINLCRIANGIRDENLALKASYEMLNDANLKQAMWMADMEKENAQLKELLKECKDLIELMQAISGIKQIKFTVIDDFVKKINEVLDA